MVKLKLKQHEIEVKTKKLEAEISEYETAVVKSAARVEMAGDGLKGEAYETLIKKINKSLKEQQRLVAECKILSKTIRNFVTDLSAAENKARSRFDV